MSVCQLVVEFGVGVAVLVRCFVDRKAMDHQIVEKLGIGFSRPPFATVVVCFPISLLIYTRCLHKHSILIMFIGKVLQIYKQALSGCCYLCDQHIRLETNVHFLLLLFITGHRMQKIIIGVGFVEEMINWSLQMLSSYCYSSILCMKTLQ